MPPATLVPWLFTLLGSRVVNADFHFLTCISTGPSATPIPSQPSIVVPANDMENCSGVLGPRMVLLENLTQPVGSAGVVIFSIEGLCDAPRLEVWTESSDLLGVYIAGGDGVRRGDCGPSNTQNYSCGSQALSLNCNDSWTCFTGICEAPRADSTSTTLPPGNVSNLNKPSAVGALSPGGPCASASSQPVPATATATPSSAAKTTPSSKSSIIVGCVLGAICLGLGLSLTFALCSYKRKRRGKSVESPSPMSERAASGPEVLQIAPVAVPRGPLVPRPFLAFQAARPSLKTGIPAPISAARTSARAEGSNTGAEAFPPSYSDRGEGSEHAD
ncbi:hypothetical protein DFH09DRAFT_1324644 [Mycena vulgaris]|nr:hypothetical protein DFH09DRAFT_1324644 [Mycena vulgaris]